MSKPHPPTTAEILHAETVDPGPSPRFLKSRKLLNRLRLLKHTRRDTRALPMYRAWFWGDLPQGEQDYEAQRVPPLEGVPDGIHRNTTIAYDSKSSQTIAQLENLRYSKHGFAYHGTALDVSSSTLRPSNLRRMLSEQPLRPGYRFETATVIQSHHPFTYGDWIAEHILSIAHNPDFPRPLLLPDWIAQRGYVQADLTDLGIDYVCLDKSASIKHATILQKPRTLSLMLREDVEKFRALFNVPEVASKRGSMLYLSRETITNEHRQTGRSYASQEIGQIVSELGGKVLTTHDKSRADYAAFADQADIVIADHGAAMLNCLQWRPRVVIEIVADGGWNNCFAFISSACGAQYHALVRCTDRTPQQLREQIEMHINFANSREFDNPVVDIED